MLKAVESGIELLVTGLLTQSSEDPTGSQWENPFGSIANNSLSPGFIKKQIDIEMINHGKK